MVRRITRRDALSLIGSVPVVGRMHSTNVVANTSSTDVPWPVFGGNGSNTKYKSAAVGPTQRVSESWSLTVNDYTGKRGDSPVTYPHPIVAEQTLFIDGSALNIADGTTRWTADWDATPCYHGSNLITYDGNQIVSRDSQDGSTIYQKETEVEPLHLSVVGDVLYMVPRNEHTAVLTTRDAHTGDIISRVRTIEDDEKTDEFFYRSEFPPILSENTVLIRYHRRAQNSILWRAGPLTAIDTDTGERRWSTQEGNEWPVAIADGTIFSVGGYNGVHHSINAYEEVSGNRRWKYEYEHGELTGPAVTARHVVVGVTDTDPGGIRSLDPADGTEQWATELAPAATVPIIVGDQIFIGTEQDEIVAVSLENGSVEWKTESEPSLHRSSLSVGNGRLVVSGKNGGISVFSDVENTPPEAVIEYEPTSPTVGDTVRFNAFESDDEHGIETYSWRFSGVESFDVDGPVVERSFDTAGEINATLQVIDEFGKADETTTTLSISHPHEQPTAKFEYTPSNPVIDEEIVFDGSGSVANDGSIVNYEWDFGNGFVAGNEVTRHSFDQSGEYTVTLRVHDAEGLVATQQQIINVDPQRANIQISATDLEPNVGEPTIIEYSITNFITSDEITVQLLVEQPSGVTISRIENARGTNQFTAVGTVSPGEQETIRIHIEPTAAGSYEIDAIADYYTGDAQTNSERVSESLQFEVEQSEDAEQSNRETTVANSSDGETADTDPPDSETDDATPGFGVTGALSAIGGLGYLIRRRSKETDAARDRE